MADDPLSITFAALADPTRRAILARLADGEATVNELAEPFAMSLQAVSKHLKVLEHAGLISRGRNAQYRPCRLEADPLAPAIDWIERNRTDLGRTVRPTRATPAGHPTAATTHRSKEQVMNDTSTNLGEVSYTRIYDAPPSWCSGA